MDQLPHIKDMPKPKVTKSEKPKKSVKPKTFLEELQEKIKSQKSLPINNILAQIEIRKKDLNFRAPSHKHVGEAGLDSESSDDSSKSSNSSGDKTTSVPSTPAQKQ